LRIAVNLWQPCRMFRQLLARKMKSSFALLG
jgi:hypothetical protein